MPVPVPRAHISPPHIVNKKRHSHSSASYSCQNSGLLQSPIGPPPSFSTRDKWSASLPSSRRARPRRIWEDDSRSAERGIEQGFTGGLAVAHNASAIKGPHAQASIPPMYLQQSPMLSSITYPDVTIDSWDMVPKRSDRARSWSTRSLSLDQTHQYSTEDCLDRDLVASILSPLYAEPSPGGMSDTDPSSPMQPVTPDEPFDHLSEYYSNAADDDRSAGGQLEAVPEEPVLAPAVAPTTSSSYKKLAQPLASWAADAVWKLCTGGVELPANMAHQLYVSHPSLPFIYANIVTFIQAWLSLEALLFVTSFVSGFIGPVRTAVYPPSTLRSVSCGVVCRSSPCVSRERWVQWRPCKRAALSRSSFWRRSRSGVHGNERPIPPIDIRFHAGEQMA